MSAKQHHDAHAQIKSSDVLAQLPPEIWFDIFRIATFVPGILSPDLLTLDFYKTPTTERRQLTKRSLITKRYIARVCKQWNAIGTQLLYENIVVGKGRTLPSLCTTLSSSHHVGYTSTSNQSVGWWTKRFDIALRDFDNIELLENIVAYLPNLIILTFYVNAPKFKPITLPRPILQAVARSNPNLKVITWYNDVLMPSIRDWHAFLVASPNLYAIHTGDELFLPNRKGVSLALPALNTLSISQPLASIPRRLPNMHLPSLRHIVYRALLTGIARKDWTFIIKNHGINLTSVKIQYEYQEYQAIPYTVQDDLNLLSTCCPNLHTLELALGHWSYLGGDPILPSSVKRFGLRSRRLQAPGYRYDWLFNVLANVARHQTLEVVQFIDQKDVENLCEKHRTVFLNAVEMLKVVKLRLEDHEGHLLE